MMKKFNPNLVKLLNILNDGQYHDGDSVGRRLGMTRSAVWKTIKKLEAYEVAIDSVKGKGYALFDPLILLETQKIKKRLNEKVDLHLFESIASTNDYLKSIKPVKGISFCLAEQQTSGKGRLNREWYSPFGRNIYLSCLYSFQKDISELSGLSLVISLTILKTLKNYGITGLFVKWPNDIVHGNKKIAGSLIEIQAETHGFCQAIIGVGLNVNMLGGDLPITQAWTSMRKILGSPVDRNELCARLINTLLADLREFEEVGFSGFVDRWSEADALANQTITLKNVREEIRGKVAGINEHGHLLLRLANGSIRAFSSGDTSIVKKGEHSSPGHS
ncbi:biotin--[acetyl-CoA-carboxylase] ligase [Aquicella lusitana]|nr:biotin--[acetyl-CoA-carboxylase] ligase [Aquicella lusitana]